MAEKKDKKLWEGWKKEIWWIIFFIFLFLMFFAYKAETQACKEMHQTECFMDCKFKEGVEQLSQEHPNWQLICNYETRQCEVAGLNPLEEGLDLEGLEGLDIELLIQNDTNNTRKNTSEVN